MTHVLASAWLLALCLSLILPRAEANDRPVAGIHTIRADDSLLQLAAGAGFDWLVQLVEWREIEPVPGDFFWEYTDWLARAAEFYDLELVLRVDHPPDWAILPDRDPPVDVNAYTAFVQRLSTRYAGRVSAYIVWNEPNLAIEWAGRPPDPESYAELLCAAHAAIHAADSQALVVSAGLAPTNHADASALDDRRYLEAMYDAGAAACFDVLGVHPYGFAYPPGDPYDAHDGLNFARLVDLRSIMEDHGDEQKPVWATELGWTTAPVDAEHEWLRVGEEEQAAYLVGAFEHAASEWHWLERIAVWNLSQGLSAGDEKRGYNILAADGSPGRTYEALAAMNAERGAQLPPRPTRPSGSVEIVAPDVAIRLSDVDTYYPHWARPACTSVPCRQWSSEFYVPDPGKEPWQLEMEIMQVEEPGNRVWINGHLLDPPAIPLRGRPDFASVWTFARLPVPTETLRPGVNTIQISSAPRLPVYHTGNARFESLQIRQVRLTTDR